MTRRTRITIAALLIANEVRAALCVAFVLGWLNLP